MAHPFIPNPSQPRIAIENVLGIALQVGLPPTGDPDNGRCPQDLRAISWPDGKRVDLKWTVPKDILGDTIITRIIIKRSQLGHSAFLTDDHELIYDGPSIEHFIDGIKVIETLGGPVGQQVPPDLEVGIPATEEDLQENTYYYYTLYMTVAEEPIGIYDFGLEAQSNCQVTGLSIIDYLAHTESGPLYGGEYLYNLFSGKIREKDQAQAVAFGRERGYFQDFCHFVQGGLNILRGNAEALEHLTSVDRLPAGLVGRAFDQSTILGAWARRFAIPPERFILDVEILRRIAASMIFLYKEKGTCPGLVDFTKVLTQWDSICTEFDSGVGSCNPIYLETWDTDITKSRLVRQASLLVSAPGLLTIPGSGLTVDAHVDSLLVGPMFDQIQISSNTLDTLIFEDETVEVRFEDLITIDSVVAVGGDVYTLEITRTSGGPSEANDSEYNGYRIVDSANVLMTVTATEYIVDGSPSEVTVDSPGAPSTGVAAVTFNYVLGAAFANRDPVVALSVWTGCPTFLYDPLMDVTLRDTFSPDVLNPHDVLYSGGVLIGVAFQPGDTILTIQSGIAKFVGSATSVSGNTLTDTSANFGPNGTNEQHYLNPNQNQKRTWRIISNTTTTLTVEPDIPGVTLEQVAGDGSRYAVLELKVNRFYEILARLADLFIPVISRLFIFFEE